MGALDPGLPKTISLPEPIGYYASYTSNNPLDSTRGLDDTKASDAWVPPPPSSLSSLGSLGPTHRHESTHPLTHDTEQVDLRTYQYDVDLVRAAWISWALSNTASACFACFHDG